jgi:poly-gamma-glutamate capsule biosynthesis protein CapA/YwtB (metallophosphatase superfamily)
MGAEYNTSAQQVQRDIAHKVADQGPEFVIANNPHWVQDSEAYNGKLIVYSTGNFIFDQFDSEGTRSASIDASVVIPYGSDTQVWLDLAEQCKTFQDSCLQKIQDAHLKKPELKISYDVVAGDNSGHLTKKGSDAMLEALKVRLKWAETLKGLTP